MTGEKLACEDLSDYQQIYGFNRFYKVSNIFFLKSVLRYIKIKKGIIILTSESILFPKSLALIAQIRLGIAQHKSNLIWRILYFFLLKKMFVIENHTRMILTIADKVKPAIFIFPV